jgi:general secretion pathway protein D
MAALLVLAVPAVALAQNYDPFNKGKGSGKTPAKTSTDSIASVEFVDTSITTIFKMISDLTGWSIITSPEVTKSPPRVNIWIKNMSPQEALDQVLLMSSLVTKREGNTIQVMTFDEYARFYGLDRRVVAIKHADGKLIVAMLQPCVAAAGQQGTQSRILYDAHGNNIVLLVPSPLLDSLERLVKIIDVPAEHAGDEIQIVRLKNAEAAVLAPALERFLGQGKKQQDVAPLRSQPTTQEAQPQPDAGSPYQVIFMVEPKLNVVVMRGNSRDIKATIALLERLDVPPGLRIVSYELKYIDAKQARTILEQLLSEAGTSASTGAGIGTWGGMDSLASRSTWSNTSARTGRLRIAASDQSNRVVVEGSPRDHERVAEILEVMDKPMPPGTGSVRIYRLDNSQASEVAKVLQSLLKQDQKGKSGSALQLRTMGGPDRPESGMPGVRPVESLAPAPRMTPPTRAEDSTPGEISGEEQRLEAQVVAAEVINAVIVRAPAAQQEELGVIIHDLDRPRDQVLLEVTLVTVRSDEGFALGVEVGASSTGGSGLSKIAFTQFGIGAADTTTGKISLPATALTGLNFALINAEDFGLVLHALQTVGDIRISTSPRLLVHDNSLAELSQISEEPYQVLSQGQATTTTAFGGFVSAGTVIGVTPYISSGDWVRLVYRIEFSSFAARLNLSLPPPRRQNTLAGTVRVPADHMVVLGGLTASREDHSTSSIPFLADIPLLGEAFKLRSNSGMKETTFVFVRPIILRDPAFRDLMFVSREMIAAAKVEQERGPHNDLKMLPNDLSAEKPEKDKDNESHP